MKVNSLPLCIKQIQCVLFKHTALVLNGFQIFNLSTPLVALTTKTAHGSFFTQIIFYMVISH